jgi:Tfp pilus assembly protein PilN
MKDKLRSELKNKKINLLPDSVKNRRVSVKAKSSLGIFLFFILIAAAAAIAYLNVQIVKMGDEIEYISDKIESNSYELESQAILTLINGNIELKNSLLDEISQNNKSVTLITEILENNLPEGIKYVNLSFSSNGKISVSGVSNSNESIAKFISGVEQENFFDRVFVSFINKSEFQIQGRKHVEYAFSIACDFGGGESD